MRRAFFMLALGVLMSALAPNISAQPGGPGGRRPDPEMIIKRLDKDGDGKISKNEFPGPSEKFGLIDANRDGFLTAAEFRVVPKGAGGSSGGEAFKAIPGKLPIIDTHAHITPRTEAASWERKVRVDMPGALRNMINTMNKNGVRLSILLPGPLNKAYERIELYRLFVLSLAKKMPGRFAVIAGGATLNPMIQNAPKTGPVSAELRRKFEEKAENLLKQGAIGFGEMAALHFSLFDDHPYEETQPDHPLFLLLADIAGRHGVPIDLHMEAVSSTFIVPEKLENRSSENPNFVNENISAFERLLAHNRKAKIVWVHAGWDNTGHWTPALVLRLLRKHPNLYISLKKTGRLFGHNAILNGDGTMNPGWRKAIIAFPDRFVIGTDGFYSPPGSDDSNLHPPDFPAVVGIFSNLPKRVARMIAFENAERIYKLGGAPGGRMGGGSPQARMKGGTRPMRAKAGRKPFTEAQIRRRIIGNTIYFKAPRGNRKLYIFFSKDGKAIIEAENKPGRIIFKKWFFKEKGFLCRTFGRKNKKKHCTKIKAGGKPGKFLFFNKKFRYQATLIKGRRQQQ